jgi:hypothetical protein
VNGPGRPRARMNGVRLPSTMETGRAATPRPLVWAAFAMTRLL